MPVSPLRPCPQPGCPTLTRGGPCDLHKRDTSKGYGTAGIKRIRGAKLQKLRAELFREQPFCVLCKERLATIRDHIIPLAEGHVEKASNEGCQAVCAPCHETKRREEARRGMSRAY